MSLDGDLSQFSMLDLFRMEAREQARVMTDGLLLLERGAGDGPALEALMRAAHSLKGAAAIVGLAPVVRVAHAVEDVFVAAQQGSLLLDGAGVDALLGAVDLMQELAILPEHALEGAGARIDAVLAALAGLRERRVAPPAIPAAPPMPTAAPKAPPAASNTPAPATDELMALAGQARLHAHQLQPWIDSLRRYRRQQRGVFEVLERLHDAIAANGDPALLELARTVAERAAPLKQTLHRYIRDAENYERQAHTVAGRLVDEVLELRMCRFGDGVHGLPRMVRDLGRTLGKDVQLVVEGTATLVDRIVLARIDAGLNQLLKNAVDHGIETPAERIAAGKPPAGTIRLHARHRGGMLAIEVADDGCGVDPERIRRAVVARGLAAPGFAAELSQAELMEFLFLPGFSLKEGANEISGRGVGMDVVHDAVHTLNGTVRAEAGPGAGFRTVITLPLTQSIVRALVVDVLGEAYALPIVRVERVLRVPGSRVRTLSGRQYIDDEGEHEGAHLGLVAAARVLELGESALAADLSVVVVGGPGERYGLVVDAVRGEQSLTVQPLEPVFGKLRDVASCALLDDGAPVLILDVPDMLLSIARLLDAGAALQLAPAPQESSTAAHRVLVVDDSLTVREMQRKLLAAHGYRVDCALDGIDGWNSLRAHDYDLVITDIDMPRLDGVALVERIRKDPRFARLPVMIVSYKDRPEDRTRGLEAGADHYLAKGSFHDASLIEAVRGLIGEARA